MKKKKLWIALLALLIAGGTLGATLAFFTDEKQQKNIFVFGNIGITLSEPQFAQATNGTYEMKDVNATQEIIKDPQITVNDDSLDVYLRSSITYEGLNETEIEQLEANIDFQDGWYKSEDGKFYYNQIATENEVVPIFHKVTIPAQWELDPETKDFKIIVNAEAIQADNFTPDTLDVNGETMVSSWRNKDGKIVTVE